MPEVASSVSSTICVGLNTTGIIKVLDQTRGIHGSRCDGVTVGTSILFAASAFKTTVSGKDSLILPCCFEKVEISFCESVELNCTVCITTELDRSISNTIKSSTSSYRISLHSFKIQGAIDFNTVLTKKFEWTTTIASS